MNQILLPNLIAHTHTQAKKNDWIWISQWMSGKMKGIWSINTNPLTNPYCQRMCKTKAICSRCYSQKMLMGVRRNSIASFQYNSDLLSKQVLNYDKLPTIQRCIFRFSAHGELLNSKHLLNYINIARKNPQTIFGLWTKRLDIVQNNRLNTIKNIIFIYSNPKINDLHPTIPKKFNKIFSVYTKEFIKKHKIKINCKGSKEGGCINCLRCYSYNNTKYINEIIK